MRPRLLDLFCGAGGAAMGYHRAGFDVVGVDIKPQPHFPFAFVQADALAPPFDLSDFDVIHASPPCQAFTTLKSLTGKDYPDLIAETRKCLSGSLHVIENVAGAPLYFPVRVCGSSLGLGVRRHRYFESNAILWATDCDHPHQPRPIDVTGLGGPGGRHRKPQNVEHARKVMGIDWMSRAELSQAIPPAYTEFIGRQLLEICDA